MIEHEYPDVSFDVAADRIAVQVRHLNYKNIWCSRTLVVIYIQQEGHICGFIGSCHPCDLGVVTVDIQQFERRGSQHQFG